MKNIIYTIVLLVLILSCSKNEEEANPKLIGHWQMVEEAILFTDIINIENPIDKSWHSVDNGYKIIFKKDNSFTSTQFGRPSYGTYTMINDSIVKLDHSEFDELFLIVSNNSNQFLHLRHTSTNEFPVVYFESHQYKLKRID
jgi:hypothetical protein